MGAVTDMLAQALAVATFDLDSRRWLKDNQPERLAQNERVLAVYAAEQAESARCALLVVEVMHGRMKIERILAGKD